MTKPASISRTSQAFADFDDVGHAKFDEVRATWGADIDGDGPEMDSLIEYCRLHQRKVKADGQVKEHGELVAGPNGFPIENPWMAVSLRAAAEMRKIAKELGA